jgi:hypothetical protein
VESDENGPLVRNDLARGVIRMPENPPIAGVDQERKAPSRYRLYVDESGDHAFNLLENSAHRYLCLLGVWLRLEDDYVAFSDALDAFKREFFGPRPDRPVILHRSDVINRKGPFGVLSNADTRVKFEQSLLQLLAGAQFRFVCVVIDKRSHAEKYTSPFHPYHYCLAALLDRYSGWLNLKNAVGDVMAESRGKEEDLQLKQAYRRVYESGTLMFGHRHHQRALTSKEIKLKRKRENIAGLQLADLLAYPVKQECLVERHLIDDPGPVFGKQIVAAIRARFNCHEGKGTVAGYGKVWL